MARRRGRRALGAGLLASALAHLGLAWLLAANRVGFPRPPLPPGAPELVVFRDPLPDPPPEVFVPPPSEPIPRPAPPSTPSGAPSATELTPPEVIPHDVPPRLLNGATISAALETGFPDDLADEASEALVLLWLFVDARGRVTKLRVQRSSGFVALDELATAVAPRMTWTPALHRGQRVGVWVAQRIRFRPPEPADAGGGRPGGPGSGAFLALRVPDGLQPGVAVAGQ